MRTAADRKAEAARHQQITDDRTKHLTPNKDALNELGKILDSWARNPIQFKE